MNYAMTSQFFSMHHCMRKKERESKKKKTFHTSEAVANHLEQQA
jgi:hypothetical protein